VLCRAARCRAILIRSAALPRACSYAALAANRDAVKRALSRDRTVDVPDAIVRRVFEICDTNRDGVIAFDEFAKYFCK
jgi:hypothetical protein